ncbi:MAG: EAL domain-containing protein [Pseudomonadota bacterium]
MEADAGAGLAKTEPLSIRHLPAMQSGAALLVYDPQSEDVVAASAQAALALDLPVDTPVGLRVTACLDRRVLRRLEDAVLTAASAPAGPLLVKRSDADDLWVRPFRTGALTALEIEPERSEGPDPDRCVAAFRAAVLDLQRADAPVGDVSALVAAALRQIEALTRHSHVWLTMCSDAEAAIDKAPPRILAQSAAGAMPDLEPNLQGPRFKRDTMRSQVFHSIAYVADSARNPVPLIPPGGRQAQLDLTQSLLCAVPADARMRLLSRGIRTSLTLPVALDERMWGLLFCMHPGLPRPVGPRQRQACRTIAGLLAIAIQRNVPTIEPQTRTKTPGRADMARRLGPTGPGAFLEIERGGRANPAEALPATRGKPDGADGADGPADALDLQGPLCDPVTGLPDRAGLLDHIATADPARPGQTGGWPVCLTLHIDDLAAAIDRLGMRAGDQLARQLAMRLKSVCRRRDLLARLDRTVFAIMLSGEVDRLSLRLLSDRIGTLVEAPIPAGGRVVRLSCRVGIADLPGADGQARLAGAEMALREARRRDAGQPVFYAPSLREAAQGRFGRARALHDAVRGGGFVCLYQPRIDTTSLEVRGLEALMHWQHPTQGLIAPADYRDLAEDLTLIEEIDALALSMAMQDRMRWLASGLVPPPITMSISARRLTRRALIETVRRLRPPPRAFSMAFQEAALLDSLDERTKWNIEALRDLGVGIEIDAFGAAQTSMLSLMHVMPDRLKIHRLLVEPILRSETALNLVESIVEIGNTIGTGVVADGSETMGHVSYLRAMGCELTQGAAFAPNTGAQEVPGLVAAPGWLAP